MGQCDDTVSDSLNKLIANYKHRNLHIHLFSEQRVVIFTCSLNEGSLLQTI